MPSRARLAVQDGYPHNTTFAKMPKNGFHGLRIWDETNRQLLTWDDELKLYFPADPLQTLWSTTTPRYVSSDFKEATLNSNWDVNSGSDAQALDPAILAANSLGKVRCTTGNAGTGVLVDGSAIAGPLVFEAEEGKIKFTALAQLSAITDVYFFLGFTDVLPSTTLEEPISLAVATFTSTATDAVGFMFDTAATTDTIRCVGVKGDADATPIDTGIAPVVATDKRYQIEIDKSGNAEFLIDGTSYGTIANAVSPGADLCPIAIAVARSATSVNFDIDLLGAH